MRKQNLMKAAAFGSAMLMAMSGMTAFAAEGKEPYRDSAQVLANVNSHFLIHIPKAIRLGVDEQTWVGTGTYRAGVEGDIDYGTSVFVVPQATFDFSNGKASVVASTSQDKTEWTYDDLLADEIIWAQGGVTANDLEPGSWEGVFYFNIDVDGSGANHAAVEEVKTLSITEDQSSYSLPMQISSGGRSRVLLKGVSASTDVAWSSDSDVITVDEGYIDASKASAGDSATITATSDAFTVESPVTIYDVAVESDTVNAHTGETVSLSASVEGASASETVAWKSPVLALNASGNIATVSTGESEGTYKVSASYGAVRKEITVNVLPGVAPSLSGVTDGGSYVQTVTFTVGSEDKVTVNGEDVTLNGGSYTINQDTDETGTYTIVVTGSDKTDITATITVSHEHAYGSYSQVTAATCTAGGTEKHTCSRCGKEETRATDALGHNWGAFTAATAATCTAGGTEERTCSRCSAKDSRTTDALGHNWQSSATTKEMVYNESASTDVYYRGKIGANDTETRYFANSLNVGKMYLQGYDTLYKKTNKAFTSTAVYTVTLNSPTSYTLAYDAKGWKGDKFTILVNGTAVHTCSFTKASAEYKNSQSATFNVPAGTNTIKFQFSAGASTDSYVKYSPIGNITVNDTKDTCSRCGATK